MKNVVHNIKVPVKFAEIQEVIVVCMDIFWFFLNLLLWCGGAFNYCQSVLNFYKYYEFCWTSQRDRDLLVLPRIELNVV